MQISELYLKSNQYRRQILEIIYTAGAGHTGGCLSCIDILNVLYNRVLNVSPKNFSAERDRYIQSKGHAVEALYTVLADRGFFSFEDLRRLCKADSPYIGHPTRKIPGIEQNTGALGHGLPLSAGVALAAKLDGLTYRVFTLLGDGELAEGSNWEAALFAAHRQLDNLTAIVDCNGLQITGRTDEVCATNPLDQKFAAFGWQVEHVDGHDIAALLRVFEQLPRVSGKPLMVIAHTVKGKGVSYMENQKKWHHGVPSEKEFALAMEELLQAREQR